MPRLGDDAVAWRRHLIAGLARRTGAGIGISGELTGTVRGPRGGLGAADWGWGNGFDRAGWLTMLAAFQGNALYNPLMNAYVGRMPGDPKACLSRPDLIADRDWYGNDYYEKLHRAMGADATLACFSAVPGRDDEHCEFYLCRHVGEPDFSPRQKALVREAITLIGPLVGGPLARFAEPCPSALPPRARQVLRCLLEGDCDKQIAARLGISRHTVNDYTKQTYLHFGVQGRAELLARWVKRGWGATCAWVEEG